MNDKPVRHLPFYVVIAFALCLCNLALREAAVGLGDCLTCGYSQHLAEHGGIPHPADIHEHEDDFVLAGLNALQMQIHILRAPGADRPDTQTRPSSPLLPPPKAA